jgi:hypothetical protein
MVELEPGLEFSGAVLAATCANSFMHTSRPFCRDPRADCSFARDSMVDEYSRPA